MSSVVGHLSRSVPADRRGQGAGWGIAVASQFQIGAKSLPLKCMMAKAPAARSGEPAMIAGYMDKSD
jgi:hypothetical protein